MSVRYNRTLIYGFGPYEQYLHNVTIDIIEEVRRTRLSHSAVFETRFSRKMFEEILKQYDPDIVIGVGQTSRARKIRIERRAINWRDDRRSSSKKISRDGPQYRYATLKIKNTDESTITYDAGNYVCNFSMYIMCEYAQKTGAGFAFLHVPIDIEPKRAAAFLRNTLKVT